MLASSPNSMFDKDTTTFASKPEINGRLHLSLTEAYLSLR